jgi:hypothetical protein
MTPTEQSTACVTAFLWDARVDLGNAIRRLDATVNRLGDESLDGAGADDAIRAQHFADDLAVIRAEVDAMYGRWARPEFKAAS